MSPSDNSQPLAPAASDATERRQLPFSAALHDGLSRSAAQAGMSIFIQGEPADRAVFYVEQGRVELKVVSPQGKEGIIAILGAGDFCGDDSLTGEVPRICTATCLTDSVIVRLDTASLHRAIRHEPAFAEFYLGSLLRRNESLNDNLVSQLTDSSERRLARLLLCLANCEPDSRQPLTVEYLDQETLAQMVGTTRSRVNYFMNRFRALGHIDYNGDIVVRASLRSIVEESPETGTGGATPNGDRGSPT